MSSLRSSFARNTKHCMIYRRFLCRQNAYRDQVVATFPVIGPRAQVTSTISSYHIWLMCSILLGQKAMHLGEFLKCTQQRTKTYTNNSNSYQLAMHTTENKDIHQQQQQLSASYAHNREQRHTTTTATVIS